MTELGFIDAHWGDIVGFSLVVVGLATSLLTAWKFPQNYHLYTIASGLMNGGFLAMKLQTRVLNNGNGTPPPPKVNP